MKQARKNLKVKFGFSVCTYDPRTSTLLAHGWFLGENIERIEIWVGEDRLLGHANANQRRNDVFEQYPEYDNPRSGWRFESRSEEPLSEMNEITAIVFSANKIIAKMNKKVLVAGKKLLGAGIKGRSIEKKPDVSVSMNGNLHEQEFSLQSSNLVNKLLFQLADYVHQPQ